MIVVAIIGVLAAVAIPAFLDYMKRSKATEPLLTLNKIGKNSKRLLATNGTYSATNGALLPAGGGGPGNNCCGGKGGVKGNPGSTVNNRCTGDPASFAADPGWSALEVSVDEAGYYQYSYIGGAAAFTAYGIGDIDCNSVSATYTMNGTKTGAGNPQTNIVPPPTGTY